MERFLLLWDELDELVGLGRHFAAGLTHSFAHRMRRTQRLLRSPVADQA
jgi:hypothetical protein